MKKHYARTSDGGHAAGDQRSIQALCTLPDWTECTHEEYLQAKRLARKLEQEEWERRRGAR